MAPLHHLFVRVPFHLSRNVNSETSAACPLPSVQLLQRSHVLQLLPYYYDCYLTLNGKPIESLHHHFTEPNDFLDIRPRIRGGKGGFGTLLRGKGSRGPKTSNFDSSRDLQGRRLRNANAPEQMRQWVERKVHEHEIIKAVGGEDPFITKKITAADVLRVYRITIPAGTHNPYDDATDLEYKQLMLQNTQDASLRGAAAIALNTYNLETTAQRQIESLPPTKEEYLNSYLDVYDL